VGVRKGKSRPAVEGQRRWWVVDEERKETFSKKSFPRIDRGLGMILLLGRIGELLADFS